MKNAGILSVVAIGMVGLILSAALLNGLMLSYLWEWFIVPLGVRSIGIAQAIGISVTVSMLTYKPEKADESSDALNRMLGVIAAKVVAFGIAFGISFLVPA